MGMDCPSDRPLHILIIMEVIDMKGSGDYGGDGDSGGSVGIHGVDPPASVTD